MHKTPIPQLGKTPNLGGLRLAAGPGYQAPLIGEVLLAIATRTGPDGRSNDAWGSQPAHRRSDIPDPARRRQLLQLLSATGSQSFTGDASAIAKPNGNGTDDGQNQNCRPIDVNAGLCVHNGQLCACSKIAPAELASASSSIQG